MRLLLAILVYSFFSITALQAQVMVVRPGTKMVMKDNVFLVLHNQALVNDGVVKDRVGTIKLAGNSDTPVAYIGGAQPISIHNFFVSKDDYGVAVKSPLAVRNILGVYGGTLYPDNNLSLKSDAGLTARVDIIPSGAAISGKAFVERFYPNRRAWRLITAPLTQTSSIFENWQNNGVYQPGINTWITGPGPTGASGNGLDASPQNNASMKRWNVNTQLLESVLNTKVPLSAGSSGSADNTGYFMFVRGDRDYNNFTLPNSNLTTLISSGQLQTGTQTFTASGVSGGFTLIGNPYASPVDFNLVTRNNLIKRFYVWDPRLNVLGGYVMLDDLDNNGVFAKSIAASMQTSIIQSSQAFFTETAANGSASITFEEAHKSDLNNGDVFQSAGGGRPANIPSHKLVIVLNKPMAHGTNLVADGVFAEYNNSFSDGIDTDDAPKFSNINENLAIEKYAHVLTAERRPLPGLFDTLFLKLTKTTQRKYQLEFIPEEMETPGLEAWLEDGYTEHSQPVSLAGRSAVDFNIDSSAASAVANRFRIVFKKTITSPFFTNITVEQSPEINVVKWSVTNDLNVINYVVERSADSTHFTGLNETIPGGLSTPKGSYTFADNDPLTGGNFYRIKYVLSDGTTGYSNVVSVFFIKAIKGIHVYPNPVQNNIIRLYLNGQSAGKYRLKLLNNAGQIIHSEVVENTGSKSLFLIQPASLLAAGMYQLEISKGPEKIKVQSIIVR